MNKNSKIIAKNKTDAEMPSTINIATTESNAPIAVVYLLKYLKEGLKLGAEEIPNRKHAKFMTTNVIKNVIVINVAILLTSENKHSCVRIQVKINEYNGE